MWSDRSRAGSIFDFHFRKDFLIRGKAEIIPSGFFFWRATTSLHARTMQGEREAAGGTLLLHKIHMYLQMTQPLAAHWPPLFNDSVRVCWSPSLFIPSTYNDTRPKSRSTLQDLLNKDDGDANA